MNSFTHTLKVDGSMSMAVSVMVWALVEEAESMIVSICDTQRFLDGIGEDSDAYQIERAGDYISDQLEALGEFAAVLQQFGREAAKSAFWVKVGDGRLPEARRVAVENARISVVAS